jgi:hypothetical protein
MHCQFLDELVPEILPDFGSDGYYIHQMNDIFLRGGRLFPLPLLECSNTIAVITHDDQQLKYCFKTTSDVTPPLSPFEVPHLDEEQNKNVDLLGGSTFGKLTIEDIP